MTNNEILDERIDKFLSNEMSNEDRERFLEDLSQDDELKERAQIIAFIIESMADIQNEKDVQLVESIKQMDRDELRELLDSVKEELADSINKIGENEYIEASLQSKDNAAKIIPFGIYRALKYAAVAAVFVGVIFGGNQFYSYHKCVSLYDMYYNEFSHGEIRGSGNIQNSLTELFDNVDKGKDLKETIGILEFIQKQSKDESSDYYNYKADISWNLAFAYIKDGNRQEAIRVLKEIKSDYEGKDVAEKAEEIIEQIQQIHAF